MLKTILVRKKSSLKYFSQIFYQYVKVELPIEYLEKAMVYFLYNNEKLIGGYIIMANPFFRFIDLLPHQIKTKEELFKKYALEEMYEVNGLFILDTKFTFNILRSLLRKILTLDKKYLLLFYNLRNKKLHKTWQKNLIPIEIYKGKPCENSYLKSHETIFFGYVEQEKLKQFLDRINTKRYA
ncbi:MAG: hypothetical protein ACK4PR_06240 [Gammaproteobacteria bacterium]